MQHVQRGGFASTVHSKQARADTELGQQLHSQPSAQAWPLPKPRGLGGPIPAPECSGSHWVLLGCRVCGDGDTDQAVKL